MRIAHFLYDYRRNPWLGGGAAIREWEINRRLVESGYDIHVFCGSIPSNIFDRVENGIHYHSCGIPLSYPISRLTYNFRARSRWRTYQQEKSFDLLVEDTSPFTILPPANINIPSIALVHNFIGNRLIEKMGIAGKLFAAHEQKLYQRFNHYIAVSKFLKEAITKRHPEAAVNVIHNGIDDSAFTTNVQKKTAGQLLFLGRIDFYHKGIDLLLQLFDQLIKQLPHITLLIAGGGKDEKRLIQEINQRNKNIQFLGRLGRERFELLARSEILLMPSRFEGWGITAVEAAAVGTPVVGTDIDGLKEAVKDGKTGILVQPDAALMTTVVANLLQKPEMLQVMGKAGRKHAAEFKWNHLFRLQESAYQKCIVSHKACRNS